MKFRRVQENTTWPIFNIIIDNNYSIIKKMESMPVKSKKHYAKLLAVYPLTEKQEETFFKLTSYKKAGYLSKHLIKECRKNNVSHSLINKYFRLKNEYIDLKESLKSKEEYRERIKIYLLYKDYDSIFKMYMDNESVYDSFTRFIDFNCLLIDILIDETIVKIRKSTKIKRIETDPFSKRGKKPWDSSSGCKKYGKNPFDEFDVDSKSIEKEMTEIESFIEEQVEKRVRQRLNDIKNKDDEKKPKRQTSKKLESVLVDEQGDGDECVQQTEPQQVQN